ncbi:MAG: ABC transporter ATP-binding protein [Candidatus Ventricola sp.]|nr:ABC transporter ATP-binding protein [Candidatus Ventricola sp.]
MMEEVLLSLRHISKNFGEGDVLADVSLDVHKGEFVTLLGASGCGKTTTLRIVSGLETPDAGEVVLNGQDMTDWPPERRPVNTVFQSYALFPHMNVEKNVAYGLKVRGVDKKTQAARVKEMLELVQMSEYAKRMPAQLSGGQRQRIAIARALAPQPQLLLLDEPLGALDLQLRRQMQIELKRLQKKLGITFIYITHDQEEAINMSDRIAVMRGGKFEQLGTPEEIYDHPATRYVAQFIGRSALLEGTVRSVSGGLAVIENENGRFTVGGAQARLTAGERCEVCVRTERMRAGRAPVEGFDLPATVRETRYAGGSVLTYAVLSDGTEVVAEGEERMSDAPQAGETVYMHWNPAQASVIGGASHGA